MLALVLSLAIARAVADDRVQESVDVQIGGLHCQLQGLHSLEAVRRLMGRHQLEGVAHEFVHGYKKELQHNHDSQETESVEP